MISAIQATALRIRFKQSFKHASADRAETQTLWVEAKDAHGHVGFGESCPREYVTAESLDSAQAFVEGHGAQWCSEIRDFDDLRAWQQSHRLRIDGAAAGWAAAEMAMLDLMARVRNCSVEKMLGQAETSGCFVYSAVLGDAAPAAFEAQLAAYLKAGFRQFKIKLSGDAVRDAAHASALKRAGISPQDVRADANNLFTDAPQALAFLRALDFPFFAIEEPLAAGDYVGMAAIADALGCRIILDESLTRSEQLLPLAEFPQRWIGNVRISKMGGLLRSLDLVADARRLGFSVIVGAHVGETSLLTRAALSVARAAGDVLLAQEGAFGTHLLTRDIIDPPLMFGAGGVLKAEDYAFMGEAGFGLTPSALTAS